MLETLRALDTSLFLFLNGLHNSVLDFIMYWLSDRFIWIPFYVILVLFLYREYPRQFFSVLIFTALLIALCDQLSSAVIKNAAMRLRPCHDPVIGPQVHLVDGYCGGQYGFISSHASNSFALVTFLIFFLKKKFTGLQYTLLCWAILVSYSRIYLGVHYPGDVICGALLGILLGLITGYSYRYYLNRKL